MYNLYEVTVKPEYCKDTDNTRTTTRYFIESDNFSNAKLEACQRMGGVNSIVNARIVSSEGFK